MATKSIKIEMSSGPDISVSPRQQELLLQAYDIFPNRLGVDGSDSRTFWALVEKELLACSIGPKTVCELTDSGDVGSLEEQGIKAVGMPTPLGAEVAMLVLEKKGSKYEKKLNKIKSEYTAEFGGTHAKVGPGKRQTGNRQVKVKKGRNAGKGMGIVVEVITPSGRDYVYGRTTGGQYVKADGDGEMKPFAKNKMPKYVQEIFTDFLASKGKPSSKKSSSSSKRKSSSKESTKGSTTKRAGTRSSRRKRSSGGFYADKPGYGEGATRAERRSALRAAFTRRGGRTTAEGHPRLTDGEKAALAFVSIIDAMPETPRRVVDINAFDGRRTRLLKALKDSDLIFYDNINRVTPKGFSRPVKGMYTFRLTPQGKLYIEDFLQLKGKPTKRKVVTAVAEVQSTAAAKEVEEMVKKQEKTAKAPMPTGRRATSSFSPVPKDDWGDDWLESAAARSPSSTIRSGTAGVRPGRLSNPGEYGVRSLFAEGKTSSVMEALGHVYGSLYDPDGHLARLVGAAAKGSGTTHIKTLNEALYQLRDHTGLYAVASKKGGNLVIVTPSSKTKIELRSQGGRGRASSAMPLKASFDFGRLSTLAAHDVIRALMEEGVSISPVVVESTHTGNTDRVSPSVALELLAGNRRLAQDLASEARASKPPTRGRSRLSNPGEITVMASDDKVRRALGKSAKGRAVKMGNVNVEHIRGGLYRLDGPAREARALKIDIEMA